MENNFGKGAIKDVPDKRDYKYSDAAIAFGSEPFDWEKGYDVEEKIGKKLSVKDQNGSSSCGGQAWGYYGQVLDPEHVQKSAKFIYAQTFVPPGGSAGRTNCDLVTNKGWGDEALTPSYDNNLPPKEPFMQRKEDITPEAFANALGDKALSYAQVDLDIDSIAQAIRDNGGCVIGITGKNNGTWGTSFPIRPQKIDNTCWNHWIFAGKCKLIGGVPYIGFINSWGEDTGEKGWQWVSADYLQHPYVWSCWTLVYKFPKFKFTKTLALGSVGNEVKELQKRLGVKQTGVFFILTRSAVKEYQRKHGLVADGIVGVKTREQLNK